ncbi:hypothetical protein [Kitasatospora cineracea]|uniref:Uncharacterized protein n=1 Tax=Kitasatospora cineracea TaxID=88074 RepID=A0A3N4S173_9ACTN|nr:hypothetical protein [Kitasatospora cineracea]RPE36655.1 hypothetical protein EDD38_5032 [Kitasatospora cineracea]
MTTRATVSALRDETAPLYRLLVLTVLCSVRTRADTAAAAARPGVWAGPGPGSRAAGTGRPRAARPRTGVGGGR